MKRIEDIEKMSFEELESVADNSCVKAPEGLRSEIMATLAATALQKKKRAGWQKSGRIVRISAITAAVLACMTIVFNLPKQPEDTYSDPLLAYAELEKAFTMISSKTTEIFNK